MSYIDTYPLQQSTILRINSEKELIILDPEYQRNGDIWTTEKRQLLIDSILNDYDIPKLYFHVLSHKTRKSKGKEFAIIDGRQRLETIWKFIKGDFCLSDDFKYLKDEKIKANGLTYSDLSKHYPRLKTYFDSYTLPIICVRTDDLELIEDMFSRLNEAVPLNAAEKRNAFGGPMAKIINRISAHKFFTEDVKFSNSRYQHKEIAARILFLFYSIKLNSKIIDTKKVFLDNFVKEYKIKTPVNTSILENKTKEILNKMYSVFTKKDNLLKSQSSIPIYFLVFRKAIESNSIKKLSRKVFINFRDRLEKNRKLAEEDISRAKFEFLEYDRLSQQGTNDASSIKRRFEILNEFIGLPTSLPTGNP